MSDSKADQPLGAMLRWHRERLGISVRTLATRSDFSPSFISQVENGLASPSIGSLEKIASCLGVSLAELFDRKNQAGAGVVRAKHRPRIESAWSHAEIESLKHDAISRLEPLLITLQPGGASGKKPRAFAGEHFVFVVSGTVDLVMGGAPQKLSKGDAIPVRSHVPALWSNVSGRPVQLLFVSNTIA